MSFEFKSRPEVGATAVTIRALTGAERPVRTDATVTLAFNAAGGVYRGGLKRAFDLGMVLIAAPFIVMVIGLLAGLVALNGGHPFYAQDRVGRGGKVFRMWKLRSMVVGAEAQLQAHLAYDPAAQREWDLTQKLQRDPRITAVGRILRRTSLDELPQLWNVLRGDMSLVGPRPMLPCQQVLYPGHAYYRLRPGLTGPWQVSERNESAFAKRAIYDRHYDQTLSFASDLRLLVQTVGVVARATGY